jgi:deoxyadenosine/deoxycytidine kinase
MTSQQKETHEYKIISIEGNIGAGKTTLLNRLQDNNINNEIVFVKEPVDVWETFKDSNDETMLEKFYKDPNKYAFAFQIMAFTTRVQTLENAIKSNPQAKLFICERSLEADKYIFAKMLHDDKVIDDVMYQVYCRSFQQYLANRHKLSGIIYVCTNPALSYERIGIRGREGESKITMEYLERCHQYHLNWLEHTDIPVLESTSNYDSLAKFVIDKFLQSNEIYPPVASDDLEEF